MRVMNQSDETAIIISCCVVCLIPDIHGRKILNENYIRNCYTFFYRDFGKCVKMRSRSGIMRPSSLGLVIVARHLADTI